jgi:hypothetical protein
MEANNDYEYDDDTIDELIENIPATMVDSRTYYYMSYPGVNITYNRAKFQHTIYLLGSSTLLHQFMSQDLMSLCSSHGLDWNVPSGDM